MPAAMLLQSARSLAFAVVAVLAALAPAAAQDASKPDPDAAAQLVTISAGNGMSLSIRSQQPTVSQLTGGVVLGYEKVKIAADAMDFVQSVFPGTATAILDEGRMNPGAKGPTPDRVLLDTRETQLPRIGFHGTLTPASAHILRLPPDPALPKTARYRVLLTSLGDFSGSLLSHGDWFPFEGWADHADVDLSAEVGDRGLGEWTIRTITLYGAEQPKRKAMLRRLNPPTLGPEPEAQSSVDRAKNAAAEVRSSTIVISFLENGDSDIHFGGDTEGNLIGDLLPPAKNNFKPAK
jgi:hypothetical protein